MADYLPLRIKELSERANRETGEITKSIVCETVQPETITLNLTRVDALRVQQILDNQGKILMVPIRRGEIEGRAFTSIAPGALIPIGAEIPGFTKPEPPVVAANDETKPEPPVVAANDEQKPAKAPMFGKA